MPTGLNQCKECVRRTQNKKNEENREEARRRRRKRYKEGYGTIAKARQQEERDTLHDTYVVSTLTNKTGLGAEDVRRHPLIIKAQKQKLLLHRKVFFKQLNI